MDDINIAMLIDADNVSAKYIPGILSELSKFGKITVRRMYGDWSQDRLHSWLSRASGYSLTPIMQPNNTPGKNASDIGLIIDAMDILYTGDVQGFCIVSSDGDFNKLATRLREAGKVVIGMGEKKTPESFRVSCERFIFLEVINESDNDDDVVTVNTKRKTTSTSRKKGSAAQLPAPAALYSNGYSGTASGTSGGKNSAGSSYSSSYGSSYNNSYSSADSGSRSGSAGSDTDEQLFTPPETIEATIVKMIEDNNAEGKETGLGEIGSRLVKIFPDFDIRNYHYSKLSEFGLPEQLSRLRYREPDSENIRESQHGRHVYQRPEKGTGRGQRQTGRHHPQERRDPVFGLSQPHDPLRGGQRQTCDAAERIDIIPARSPVRAGSARHVPSRSRDPR